MLRWGKQDRKLRSHASSETLPNKSLIRWLTDVECLLSTKTIPFRISAIIEWLLGATVGKHNPARQPIIVLVSLYSSSCIITCAMDYGYVAPDTQNTHLSFNRKEKISRHDYFRKPWRLPCLRCQWKRHLIFSRAVNRSKTSALNI